MNRNKSVFTSLCVILCISALLFSVVGELYGSSLDLHFGFGRANVQATNTGVRTGEYYPVLFTQDTGSDGTLAYARNVSKRITDEGIVLLKNNGVLPLSQQARVTPFGLRFFMPVYSGNGSGHGDIHEDYVFTPQEGLSKYFQLNLHEQRAGERVLRISPDGITETDLSDCMDTRTAVYEYPSSIYDGWEESCAGTVGIVFIGRIGGESSNFSTAPLADGTPHVLALTKTEREMIRFSRENCTATVAIINSANVMEIEELMYGENECDAIVWLGGAGNTGFESLGDILAGTVNPSGRTVDIWDAKLLENPVQANFSDCIYENTRGMVFASNYDGTKHPAGLYYQEYEEGIYVGYRYFETAAALGEMAYGVTNGAGEKTEPGAVNYPFGYGLSYTTFSQRILKCEYSPMEDTICLTIEVTNTGSRDGQDVVQIYVCPPYTAFDQANGIEKASRNLVAFEKVSLETGEKKTIQILLRREDLASYAMNHENKDGTRGCYYLEAGNYELIAGKNSHEAYDTKVFHVDGTVFYDVTNLRRSDMLAQGNSAPIAVTNQFEDVTAYMQAGDVTNLTRCDWAGTQPTRPQKKALADVLLDKAYFYTPLTNGDAEPFLQKQNNGLVLADMRGRDYDDPLWETFLDQLDYSEAALWDMLLKSSGHTAAVAAIGKPLSYDKDGPQQLRTAKGSKAITFTYGSEVVLAVTFNKELAYAYGESIGNEALVIGLTGWYGPGLNLHRSAFNGRNFEYFSEDPLLSGKLAAKIISGAASRGVVSYVKHFAMNNYEGPGTCLAVWATEQTIREIYLRGFEIAVKEAWTDISYYADKHQTLSQKRIRAATGMMGAANRIGIEWCAANAHLLENVLRGEWGFRGTVTTDMSLQVTPGIADRIFRNGGDLRMYYYDITLLDASSQQALASFRRAVKNVCYTYANSNLMQQLVPGNWVSYGMSPWRMALLAYDLLVLFTVVSYIVYCLRKRKKKKRLAQLHMLHDRKG